jgi:hypothetical protein
VSLAQLVRFLVMEIIHSVLNSKFNMSVTFMTNYSLVGADVSVDSNTLLVTDFVNLRIKPAQFFQMCSEINCTCVCSYTCIHIYIYTMFLKKRTEHQEQYRNECVVFNRKTRLCPIIVWLSDGTESYEQEGACRREKLKRCKRIGSGMRSPINFGHH